MPTKSIQVQAYLQHGLLRPLTAVMCLFDTQAAQIMDLPANCLLGAADFSAAFAAAMFVAVRNVTLSPTAGFRLPS